MMAMGLTLLEVGDRLRLFGNWTFTLTQERRNHEFALALGLMDNGTPWEALMVRIGTVTGKNYYETRPFPESERYYFERDLATRLQGSRRAMLDMTTIPEFDRGTVEMLDGYKLHATVPAGAELIVDRVYIRQGAEDFNSLSFRVTDPGPNWSGLRAVNMRGFKKQHRFFAALRDCRHINADVFYKSEEKADG